MNLDRFKEPPVQYRPAPFFSVNDQLEEERLLEFIEEFHCQGWGGFFFHARTGLVTPYLSNRWFNLVKSCVRKFEEIGGRFWIYDEDGWPSGKGGGQVTKLAPEFRSMLLYCRPSRDSRPPLNTLARREMEIDGEMQSFDFFAKVMPMGHIPNLLNPDAVGCFLESTHELYEIHLGNEFGETVPGIFTDEPQYATHHSQSGKLVIPWAKDMVDRFEVEHGYNLADHIESLFFDEGEFRKVRYDYYSTLTRLFVEAFSKQVHDWCEERSLSYTGHYEWEDSLLGQIHCIGSAMQHYEYMQQPGIDHLGKGIHNPWVEKQVASVSSQLGKRRVLSESYGTSGQALDFHDRRWIGNFQYALGVNFLCQHLALYSLRGARKRDYPPTLSPHQPWWEYNRMVADYFTRLSYVLSHGDRLVDVLVIHPIGSAWAEYSPSRPDRVEDVFEKFRELTWNLLRSQIDFEYGEEFIIEKHGEVRGGKLVLGRQKYRVVVIPSMKSIRRSTFELLKDLSESGGEIILVGEVPYLIEGEESGELQDLLARAIKTKNSERSLASKIKPFLSPGPSIEWVSGAPLRNLLIHRRRLGNSTISFMVNMHYSKTMRLNVDFEDEVQELVPHTGEVLSRPRNTTFDLAGGQGRLFLVNPDFQVDGEAEEVLDEPLHITEPDSSWKISRSQPNQAVMDFARWRPVNGSGEWSEILPVWQVQEAVSSLNNGAEFEVEYELVH